MTRRFLSVLLLTLACGGGDGPSGPTNTADPGGFDLAVTPGAGVAGVILQVTGRLNSATAAQVAGVTTKVGAVGTTTRLLLLLPSGIGRTTVATVQSPDRKGAYSVQIVEVVGDASSGFAALPVTAVQAELIKK